MPPDANRAHELGAAPASSRHNASIARRPRDGRRSRASPRCRMATSCPDRGTTRSRCGKMSKGRWRVWSPCAGLRRISPGVSSPRSSRTVGLFRFRVASARDVIYWCSLPGLYEWEWGLPRSRGLDVDSETCVVTPRSPARRALDPGGQQRAETKATNIPRKSMRARVQIQYVLPRPQRTPIKSSRAGASQNAMPS